MRVGDESSTAAVEISHHFRRLIREDEDDNDAVKFYAPPVAPTGKRKTRLTPPSMPREAF